MKKISYLLFSLLLLTSCDGWINNASTPNDSLTIEELSKPGMIASIRNNKIVDGPLIANIKTLRGDAASSFFLAAGAMSGEVIHAKMPNIILYKQLFEDNISSNSGQSDGIWNTMHNYRARAEELLKIENTIANSNIEQIEAIRSYTRYIGNMNAGYAWQLLAEAFSAMPSEAKGVKIEGTLYSQEIMFQQAQKYYDAALIEADNAELKKLHTSFESGLAAREVQTLKLKLHIHIAEYEQASKCIDKALKANESVNVIYNSNGSENGLYSVLGLNALNAQIDSTLILTLRNTAEKKAIAVKKNKNNNYYLTNLDRYSSLIISDYNEVQLIRAELILRGYPIGNLLNCVNSVITSYDAASVETNAPDMALLTHLRTVYLYLRGERLTDFRRKQISGNEQIKWDTRVNKWMPFPENEK